MPNWLLKRYKPDYYFEKLADIDWPNFFEQGYRLVLVDVDNTIQAHGEREISETAIAELKRIQALGFKITIVTNAKPHRSQKMQEGIQKKGLMVEVFGFARKPKPRRLLEACVKHNIPVQNALMLGDQIFTDVRAGKNANICTILVKTISHKEPWYIKLKRIGESIILKNAKFNKTP